MTHSIPVQDILHALIESSRAFLDTSDFKQSTQIVYECCKKMIGATSGYVALLSADKTQNEILFLDMGGMPCSLDPDLPMPIRGFRAQAYSTGQAVYENNFQQSEWLQYLPDGHGTLYNVLFAPLVIDNNTVGIFGFANKPGGFSEDDALIARTFAELAAIGLLQNKTVKHYKRTSKRLNAIMETAQDAIITVDERGDIFFWNKAAEKLFGYSSDEIIGKPCMTIIPEKYRKAHRGALANAVKTGISTLAGHELTVEGLRKNNELFSAELSLSKWQINGDVFFTGILRDISSRMKMEVALQDNEILFRTIFETSPDPININRLEDGKFIKVNRKFLELTGYEKSEVVGKTAIEINIWENLKKRNQFFSKLHEKGQIENFEAEFRRKDGSLLWAQVSAALISFKKKPHLLAVTKDITELKKAEQDLLKAHNQLKKKLVLTSAELKKTEINYQMIADYTYDWEWWTNPDGTFRYVSPACERITGYKADRFIENYSLLREIIVPADKEKWDKHYNESHKDIGLQEMQFRIKRPDGEVRWIEHACQPVFTGKNEFLGFRASNRDITERKQMEIAKQETEEELRILSTLLLTAEERERKRIARDIHDSIGQALSAIKFSVENSLFLMSEETYSSAIQTLQNIIPLTKQTIEEVRRIIMDLRPSTLDDLGLIATISWMCREFESIYTHIHIDKEIHLDEADIPSTLKTVIYRILQEAMNNAVQHSKTESIRLHIMKNEDNLELLFEDYGKGFDLNEVQERKTNRKGVGLSSMKERAQMSGGSLKVKSSPGIGTTIHASWTIKAGGVDQG